MSPVMPTAFSRARSSAPAAAPRRARIAPQASRSDIPRMQRVAGGLLAAAVTLSSAMPALAEVTPVYFGNGCFWGRQKDFVDTEMKLGRNANSATAVVGYAGGQENQKPACYYYNSPESQYERQGHAEVVQVGLNSEKAKDELAMFAETYFNQFTKTRQGMIRSDPQDRGSGYRNVVGIPGGMDSELFKVFASKNKDNMKLVRGEGNSLRNGRPTEDDAINTVYIVDAEALPFHQAELYHQFHQGMGKSFPREYLVDMKKTKQQQGAIGSVSGCLEYPF